MQQSTKFLLLLLFLLLLVVLSRGSSYLEVGACKYSLDDLSTSSCAKCTGTQEYVGGLCKQNDQSKRRNTESEIHQTLAKN
eukprot:1158661-Pelagomonas_calceolata.AAC.7